MQNILGVLGAAALVVASCAPPEGPAGGEAAQEGSSEMVELTIGMLPPSLSNSGIYIAEARGYFEEQGISLNVEQFRSGDAQVASLARGDLQVATGGPSAGLYNAVSRDVGAKVVADKGHGNKDFDWAQYLTLPETHENGLKSLADLKGRSVAIVGEGATQEVGLSRGLQAHGMTMDDVNATVIPFPEMPAALESGSVDAIYVIEPTLTRLIESGDAVAFDTPTNYYPQQQHAVIFYSEQFIEESPDIAERFMVAYIKGLRDYNDAFLDGEGLEEVKQILVDNKVVEDPSLLDKVNLVGLSPNGYVLEESIQADIEFYTEAGYLQEPTSAEEVIDHSFVDKALEKLGKYDG